MSYMGKEYKEWINVIYITDALYCTPETNNIVSQLYPNKIFKKSCCIPQKDLQGISEPNKG